MNRPIKVIFDAGPLVNGQKAGVGYYTYQLIEALATNYPDEIELTGHYFNFLGRRNPRLLNLPNISYKTSVLLPGKVLSALRRFGLQLPFELLIKSKGDIALFPNYVSLPTLLPIKKVIVIHDLCFEDFPQYLQAPNQSFLKRFVPHSVAKAAFVVTISESTKKAIQKHYHISSDSILITPIPPAEPQKKRVEQPKNLNLPSKYILFMSTLEPRKNYINLVRAYPLLPERLRKEYGLVLAGGYGWQTENSAKEIKQLQDSGNKIIITGYVSEEARTYLYQNASLLAMPSHYEGFGMPILEAMSYGVPAAVSNIAVFHEVAGNAAVYFDKDDPAAIAKCIEKILESKNAQSELIKNGRAQLKKYDWDKVAANVMARFRELVDE